MYQCFNEFTDIESIFLLLFHCCILLDIKLTTTTISFVAIRLNHQIQHTADARNAEAVIKATTIVVMVVPLKSCTYFYSTQSYNLLPDTWYQAFMKTSQHVNAFSSLHDDVIKWKHFPRYWPFVRGIRRSPVNSPHKGQWRGALMFDVICAWINGGVKNREAGDLRRHRTHCDVAVILALYVWGESNSGRCISLTGQVMRRFDVYFGVSLNDLLNKQSRYWSEK